MQYSLSRWTLEYRAGLSLPYACHLVNPSATPASAVLGRLPSADLMSCYNTQRVPQSSIPSISTSLISLANGPKTDPLGEAASTT
jgi:hypothetical protein